MRITTPTVAMLRRTQPRQTAFDAARHVVEWLLEYSRVVEHTPETHPTIQSLVKARDELYVNVHDLF